MMNKKKAQDLEKSQNVFSKTTTEKSSSRERQGVHAVKTSYSSLSFDKISESGDILVSFSGKSNISGHGNKVP
jgi:hypothetical protein